MHKLSLLLLAPLAACVSAPDDNAAPLDLAPYTQSYHPLGFARVSAAGALVAQFSMATTTVLPVGVTHTAGTGLYTVTFNGLGNTSGIDGTGGNYQLTTEGTSNAQCHIASITPSGTSVGVNVACGNMDGTVVDSAFAVMFYRYQQPSGTGGFLTAAYSQVSSGGTVVGLRDFNGTGVHNTVTHTVGSGAYTVHINGGSTSSLNEGVLVSPVGGAIGTSCSVILWNGATALVACKDRTNANVDVSFFLSYALPVIPLDQQGAHAFFNGTGITAAYTSGEGKILTCSTVNVTGSIAGTLASVTVAGDLGSWDGGAYLRASFVTLASNYGYCKIEGLSASGAAPMSTATTTVRCYTPTGVPASAPHFLFTHVTSDVGGPC